ncbi:MAG: LacI family transcriptional regulator [Opitutaceae bacterium]|jgi:DNA-binding LacI/PurR family transcriptional regulator|nr:LacI family transcriptional regulator [Opitutaceae bacterium]
MSADHVSKRGEKQVPSQATTRQAGEDGKRRRRVTQLDVARVAGVSISAVSMAFKNHPRIAKETRDRIRKIATELGYRPDPLLTSLAAYRSGLRPAAYHGTLAWLINSTGGGKWDFVSHHSRFFEGAREAADRHGFTLERFDLARDGEPCLVKTASILRARNVTGIIVSPQPFTETDLTGFPWEEFSVVEMARTLAAPRLHSVGAAHFRATIQCVQRLRATGHRRIGFVSSAVAMERNEYFFLGAWLALQEMAGLGGQIPPLIGKPLNPDAAVLRRWLEEHRPDGLVIGDWTLPTLRQAGWRVPEDISVACFNLPDDVSGISGVWEMPQMSGAAAANLLVSLIQRSERGIPESPQTVQVDGRWLEGATVRAR